MSTGSPRRLALGIDGGGTKTVAWLVDVDVPDAPPLGRGQAGPGNPRAAGFESAWSSIAAAIAAAFADAALPPVPVAAACLCLAGAGRAEEQQRISELARCDSLAHVVRVAGDAEPVLAAADPGPVGVALICGTGSLAWGRNAAGTVDRAGGWGYLMGDEGSAYAIALAGLQAAVRSADGRGPQTALLHRFQQRLDAAAASDLIDRIYSPSMTREKLADLAVEVFAACGPDGESDDEARRIVNAAAGELAHMVAVVAARLDLPPGFTLAVAGSVLLRQPEFLERIANDPERWREGRPKVVAVHEPVAGAVALARKLAIAEC